MKDEFNFYLSRANIWNYYNKMANLMSTSACMSEKCWEVVCA